VRHAQPQPYNIREPAKSSLRPHEVLTIAIRHPALQAHIRVYKCADDKRARLVACRAQSRAQDQSRVGKLDDRPDHGSQMYCYCGIVTYEMAW
jgi:hypothetical protein